MNASISNDSVDQNMLEAINGILRNRMGAMGFQSADVQPGLDHDGDPVLFIDAHYRLTERPIDPSATYGLLQELRQALAEIGESRFPHLRHHFDDLQKVAH